MTLMKLELGWENYVIENLINLVNNIFLRNIKISIGLNWIIKYWIKSPENTYNWTRYGRYPKAPHV